MFTSQNTIQMRLLLSIILLSACTSSTNNVINLQISKDTTFVIPENPTGLESWLRLTITNSLQHDIFMETSHEIIQDAKSKSLYSNLYKITNSKPHQVIVQDYGQKVTVRVKGVKEKVILKIEAPTNKNEGGMSAVSSRMIKI